MENTSKRNTLICIAVLVAVVLTLVFVSFGIRGQDQVAFAESEPLVLAYGTAEDPNMTQVSIDNISYYVIKTAGNLKYALRATDSSRSYLLANDFTITDSSWCQSNGTKEISSTFVGFYYDEEKKVKDTTKLHRITFEPNSSGEEITPSVVINCGLFATFNGELRYLEYFFEGRTEVKAADALATQSGASAIYVGGLAGTFNGTINSCTISIMGSVFGYSQRSGASIYVGGIAGAFNGKIIDSVVSVSGSITAANKDISDENSSDLECLNNTLYAGGIAATADKRGGNTDNEITGSTISISGSISTNDATVITMGEAIYPRAEPNSDGCIFPAGGIFASVSQANLNNCDITLSGNYSAYGSTRASRLGAIVGGIIGATQNNATVNLKLNTITLSGTMNTSNLAYTINKILWGISVGKNECGEVYQGGLIGKIMGSVNSTSNISDLAIVRDSDFVTDTASNESPGGDYNGLLCGYVGANNAFATINKGNVWIVGTIGDTRIASDTDGGASSSYGVVHTIRVFGGGHLSPEFAGSRLNFYAIQEYSPFFNWYLSTANMMSNTPYTNSVEVGKATKIDPVTMQSYSVMRFTPSTKNSAVNMCALFLTTEIYDAGNMSQFSEEMNFEDENDSNLKLNQPWVDVTLKDDITFEKGLSTIKEFNGKFHGEGHTISFAVGTTIVDNGNVGIFGKLGTSALVENLNVRFAGTVYAGKQEDNQDTMDQETNAGILAGINAGTIRLVNCTLQQAGLITAYGKSVSGGGLVGVNQGSITQVDMTIDGKITACGNSIYLGGLVGTSSTGSSYIMVNVYAKGEIISSLAEKATTKSAYIGGFVGSASSKLELSNVVINVREYSNYNNDVLLTSCKHNEAKYQEMLEEAEDVWNSLFTGKVGTSKGDLEAFLEEYFGYNDSGYYLGVAPRSKETYDEAKAELIDLYERLITESDESYSETYGDEFDTIRKDYFPRFDCSALCSDCASSSKVFAVAGSLASANYSFSNTWVLGSYTQFPDEKDDVGVGTRKLYFTADLTTTAQAAAKGLNMIYVRNGSSYCVMDISSISPDNILFTVSIDTSKVFTGWYTTFEHTVMADTSMISQDGFRPGLKYGQIYYSSVIDSLITSYSVFDELANTTNAGQTYEGDTFVLGADLVFPSASSYVPVGLYNSAEGDGKPFNGTIDGKGYTIYINGSILQSNYSGLFGYLGRAGTIKCLTVVYGGTDKTIKSDGVFGGIAAVNYGTIGQDSTSNRVTVIYGKNVNGSVTAGGVVGINYGLIQNVNVELLDNADGTGHIGTRGINSSGLRYSAVAGGVAGINYESGIVKNTYVKNQVTLIDEYSESIYAREANGSDAYAGGIVAYNLGKVYTAVVEQNYIQEGQMIVRTSANGKAGTLVGYNSLGEVDALWGLYSLANFALPSDENGYYDALINGDGSEKGNRLVKYGHGSIETSVYANNASQEKGGSIIFKAVQNTTGNIVPFYEYTCSLTEGEIVSSAEGGSGQNFAPTVTTGSKPSLEGKTYYAIFVRSEITTEENYFDFIRSINSGFSAYVNYIFNLKGSKSLNINPDMAGYASIGEGVKFVGNLNGNGYGLYYRIGTGVTAVKPIFGVIAEKSVIQNLNVAITRGFNTTQTVYDENVSATASGLFAAINYGTITELNVDVTGMVNPYRGGSYDLIDYAGIFVGINYGTISSTVVNYLSESFQGADYAAAASGKYAGALVGLNMGVIGSDRLDSVKMILDNVTVPVSVYGTEGVGVVAGLNRGIINNVNIDMNGRLAALPIAVDRVNVGAVVGVNETDQAYIGIVTLNLNGSCVIAEGGAENLYFVGGVAGLNDASAVIGRQGENSLLKLYFNGNVGSLSKGVAALGGAVGENRGFLSSVDVYLDNSMTGYRGLGATNYAGGVVGHNSGYVSDCNVTLAKNNSLTLVKGSTVSLDGLSEIGVGAIVGVNTYTVANSTAIISGTLGVTYTASDNADKIQKANVGGLVGFNRREIKDSYAIVNTPLINRSNGGRTGLVVGYSSVNQTANTPNVWAVVSNSDGSPASGATETSIQGTDSGYNVLKIVGNATVNATFVKDAQNSSTLIRFTASTVVGMPIVWYTDISTQSRFSAQSTTFTAGADLVNCVYHVCYYDLQIDTEEEFASLYQYINAYNLFNGVMFTLNKSITVRSTLQPIGTKEHPFNGIFDGRNNTITFTSGGIAGNQYSGIFGYVADNAVISNFIVEYLDGVIVGSGMSTSAGGLAGRLGGKVENVSLNLFSAPYSLKDNAYVGALCGTIANGTVLNNVWTVIYNSAVAPIGAKEDGSAVTENTGLNTLAVLGSGVLRVYFEEEESKNFVYAVTENRDYYDDWYYNIGDRTTIKEMSNPQTYGHVVETQDELYYISVDSLRDMRYTASFIDLIIRNAEDFVRFAENVNRYGDGGAKFTMDLGKVGNNPITEITVDLSVCPPIGTRVHPFTGIFDGTRNLSEVLDNSVAYTIRVKGNLTSDVNDYTGLFGCVGESAIISNLIIRADNSDDDPDYQGQRFGDKKSVYTGYLAGYFQGIMQNVVVVLGDETELYNINSDSVGGMIGMMGTNAKIYNSWLILPENSSYRTIGGYKLANGDIVAYDRDKFSTEYPSLKVPNLMYKCGQGKFELHLQNGETGAYATSKGAWSFSLVQLTGGEPAYGFIDNTVLDPSVPTAQFISKYSDNLVGQEYLALFLDNNVKSYEDLLKIAELTNSGRRYIGIEFKQSVDITLQNGYTPIGGQVAIQSGSSIGTEYKLVEFIGAYNGNGHKIIIPENVTIESAYAGLFGILGSSARVRNLYIDVKGKIGVVSGYSNSTVYAAPLSALDNGATLENIIVVVNKSAAMSASVNSSRLAVNNSLEYDVFGNVLTPDESIKYAKNVWVLSYNNKYNNARNEVEQNFYYDQSGEFNGGVNVLTVIAAGEIRIEFLFGANSTTPSGVRIFNPDNTGNPVKEWYTWNKVGDELVKTPYGISGYEFFPSTSLNSLLLYASFLKADITTAEDLIDLAQDTNVGYDLYGLVFYLRNDVVIDGTDYVSIGASMPFNAVFDGLGHTITLAEGARIEGEYAGVFGSIGQDAIVRNTKFRILGTLGCDRYTDADILNGKVNTVYAGAVAYIQGRLENVIIDGVTATLDCKTQTSGIAFGHDVQNLMNNVWLITGSDNKFAHMGTVAAGGGESSINVMKVIGMGSLNTELINDGDAWYVKMSNDYDSSNDYSIKGWYSNYSKDNQISKALGVSVEGTEFVAGDHGTITFTPDLINRRYEVVIINTVITSVEQLLSIAGDVNVGGYTYENTSFSLGADILLTDPAFTSIGTETSHFKGTFSGSYNGSYYTITMAMYYVDEYSRKVDSSLPLFGYNDGVITDLAVVLSTAINRANTTVGVIAQYNYGRIANTIVRFSEDKTFEVVGASVGGLVGVNYNKASIENCIVAIPENVTLRGRFSVGGIVAENQGVLTGSTGGDRVGDFYDWESERSAVLVGLDNLANAIISGNVIVDNTESSDTVLYVGGAVGISLGQAVVNRLSVRLLSKGTVQAEGASAAVGGVVGRSTASLRNTVLQADGTVTSNSRNHNLGYFVGSIQGSTSNSWMVYTLPRTINSIGLGFESVNLLQINGNGVIDFYIDRDNNIIFEDVTPEGGASIDGWYINNGVEVTDSIGNVDGHTFKPANNISGRTVSVVFINTTISTVEDLIVIANTVNSGLFSTNLRFTLVSDLVIDQNDILTACIGTYTEDGAYGFKHTFDGNGHTITIKGGEVDTFLPQSYMGIFGYTTSSANIFDLNVVYLGGTFGNENTLAFGGISGINAGSITNCKVYIGKAPEDVDLNASPATLVGASVGGIVGDNSRLGKITDCEVYVYGTLYAQSVIKDNVAPNAYAGSITGSNNGTISSVKSYLKTINDYSLQAVYVGNSTGATYVGGITGSNSGTISEMLIELDVAKLFANSQIIAYAGGLAGSNIGSLQNAYIKVKDGSEIRSSNKVENISGGICGINSYYLENILIDITDQSIVRDSAIGQYRAATSLAINVWVYNNNSNINSKITSVNNMTYEVLNATPTVRYNDVKDIIERRGQGESVEYFVEFSAAIDKDRGITMFADAHTSFATVLDQVDYVSYGENVLILTSPANAQDISVKAVMRRDFGDQTELKALSNALLKGGQEVIGIFTLTKDITVSGNYTAIGYVATQEGDVSRPFGATFDGHYYTVTFTDVTYGNKYNSVFALNTGNINRFVVSYDYSLLGDAAAGICVDNKGTISNSVVYMALDTVVSNPIAANTSRNDNDWLIAPVSSANEYVIGMQSEYNRYGAIAINGNGTLKIDRNAAALTFNPVTLDDKSEFAGFSDQNVIYTAETSFVPSNNVSSYGYSFSAEFISKYIYTINDLLSLVGALDKGYGSFSSGKTYYLESSDIEIDASLLKALKEFLGTFEGNDNILKIVGSAQDNVVFDIGSDIEKYAIFQNLILDLRDLNEGVFLFDPDNDSHLINVAIFDDRQDARLYDAYFGAKISLTRVFVVTTNSVTAENTDNYISENVGCIYSQGSLDIGFKTVDRKFIATANAADDEVFLGWYVENDGWDFYGEASVTCELSLNNYKTTFISTTITRSSEFDSIAEAVANGFTFKDKSFVIANDLVLNVSESIGDYYYFEGAIDALGNVLTINGKSLFRAFGGSFANAKIITDVSYALAISLTPASSVSNVLVVSSAKNSTLANVVEGNVNNVWVVADSVSVKDKVGYLITDPTVNVDSSLDAENGNIKMIASLNSLNGVVDGLIYFKDAAGKDFYNENYDTIESNGNVGVYSVTASEKISSEFAMKVFALAVSKGYSNNVWMDFDLSLDSSFEPISGFEGVFYGCGHTITVNSDKDFALFKDMTGTAREIKLSVVVDEPINVCISRDPDAFAYVNNSIISVFGRVNAQQEGNVNNVWIVRKGYVDESEFFSSSNDKDVNMLVWNQGSMVATVGDDGVITFEGKNTDKQVFMGYTTGDSFKTSAVYTFADQNQKKARVLAYSADLLIDDIESWNLLVTAMDSTGNDASDMTFTLGADIVITSEFKPLAGFNGILDGDANSLVINSAVSFDGIATLGGSGVIKNLAIEVYDNSNFQVGATVFPVSENVLNAVVIDYVGVTDVGSARRISVDNMAGVLPGFANENGDKGGFITVNGSGDNFIFDTNDLPEYKLRYWARSDTDAEITYVNGVFMDGETEYTGEVTAHYFSCYTVSIVVTGLEDTTLRPNVTPTETYWSDLADIQSVSAQSTSGYVFWGFTYEPNAAITVVNPVRLNIDVTKLTSSIVIYAEYSLISTSWQTVTYGDLTGEEMSEYLQIDKDQRDKMAEKHYTIIRSCLPEGDTLGVVNEVPRHAGNYKITFRIIIEDGESIYVMGETDFGFSINVRELVFTDLTLQEKIYDTTIFATLGSKSLAGFIDDDADYKSFLDFSDIKFAYFDPNTQTFTRNAGSGYYLKVYSGELQNTGYGNYVHIDYKLPDGILYQYSERNGELTRLAPFTFAIQKADLTLEISTIAIDYLDQFKYVLGEDGTISFFDIDDLFKNCYTFTTEFDDEVDSETIKNTKLLVIEGDSLIDDVYHYNIKAPGDYYITTLTDALVNYNPKILGGNARFRVEPSLISVVLDESEIEYGDPLVTPNYHIHQGTHKCIDANGDGICDNAITMSADVYALYADEFGITLSYDAFVSKYLSVNMEIVDIHDANGNVLYTPIVSDGYVYGVTYKFLADNVNFNFDEALYGLQSEYDDEGLLVKLVSSPYNGSVKEYVLSIENVLKVVPRKIKVHYTGESSKVFGAQDGDYKVSARVIGKKSVQGDTVIVTRAADANGRSEIVGVYDLVFSVVDANGKDVTTYYDITYSNGVGYTYSITKRTAKVTHNGYNYYYGDKASMSNMPYVTNLSQDLIKTIYTVFGKPKAKSLADVGINIKLGYFGSDILNVGKHEAELVYTAPEEVMNCIDFVLGNATFVIVPCKLTVKVNPFTRQYNKSDALSFSSGFVPFTVSGFVGNDQQKLTVTYTDFEHNLSSGAGSYFYRPIGCQVVLKDNVSQSENAYLLENYSVGTIAYGTYTITALSTNVEVEVGYFDGEGVFHAFEDNEMYYGDTNATLRFTVDEYPGYIAELYQDEVEDHNFTDKQLNDWLIDVFSIAYTPLSYFAQESYGINFAASDDPEELSIFLHSSDNNIKLSTEGTFSVLEVYFKVKDVKIVSDSSLENPKAVFTVSAMYYDYANRTYAEIPNYGIMKEVEISKDQKVRLSDNFEIAFNVVNIDADSCTYKLSANTYSNGRWSQVESGSFMIENEDGVKTVDATTPFVSGVEIVYTEQEKLVSFIKEHPVAIAVIILASIAVVVGLSLLGAFIYRNKRIARLAYHEKVNTQLLDKHNDENAKE